MHIRNRPVWCLCQRISMASHAQSHAIYKVHLKRKRRTFGAREEPCRDSYTIRPGSRRFIHAPEKSGNYWLHRHTGQSRDASSEINKVRQKKCIQI